MRLHGQPVQVLALLLESAGQLVTREELRAALWSADTFVDFDHSLHNAIARIREVLADSAETPRYIETLPRRGYRFIAPVEKVDAAPVVTAPVPTTAPESAIQPPPVVESRRTPRAGLIVVLACFPIAVAALVAWQRVHTSAPIVAIRRSRFFRCRTSRGMPRRTILPTA